MVMYKCERPLPYRVLTPQLTDVDDDHVVVAQPAVEKPTLVVESMGPKLRPEIVKATPEDVAMFTAAPPDVTGLSNENALSLVPDCAIRTVRLKPPLAAKPAETAQVTLVAAIQEVETHDVL